MGILLFFAIMRPSLQINSKRRNIITLYNRIPIKFFVSFSPLPVFGCGLSGRGAVGACGARAGSKQKVESSGWVGVFGGEVGRVSGCD